MAVFKALILGALLLLATACSRLDVGMRWADTIVMSSVDDYFVLDRGQDKAARAEFKTALDSVRREEFPKIADGLDEFVAKTEAGQVNKEYLDKVFADAEALRGRIATRFEPMGQKIVEAQVAEGFKTFDKEFLKKYEKDAKEAADVGEQIDKARKGVDRFVDESIESLTKEQKAQLDEALKKQPPNGVIVLESRKAVFEAFKTQRDDPVKRTEFTKKFFTDWESLHTAAYRESRKAGAERFKNWLVKLFASLTDKQKKNLVENFRSRAAEFREQAAKK